MSGRNVSQSFFCLNNFYVGGDALKLLSTTTIMADDEGKDNDSCPR